MHSNDVQLIRVYPTDRGGRIFEESIPVDAEFDILVEAKAGSAIFNNGGKYFFQIVVRDVVDFSVVHTDALKGNMTKEPWVEPVFLHAFPIPAQGSVRMYRVFEALAILSVGITNPNISFAKSPVFIIYKS